MTGPREVSNRSLFHKSYDALVRLECTIFAPFRRGFFFGPVFCFAQTSPSDLLLECTSAGLAKECHAYFRRVPTTSRTENRRGRPPPLGIRRGEPRRWLEYVGHTRHLAGCAGPESTAADGHEIARTLAGWESAEAIMGLSSQRLVFGRTSTSLATSFEVRCDLGYDCVFGRDKWTFISKPDRVGALCFESGWDHFPCTTLACSKHAHDSPKLNLEYVFVIMIHHSRPHCGLANFRFGCC